MILLAFMSACSRILTFSPERAAVQEVLSNTDGQVDPSSVQVLQKLEMDESVLVLVSYHKNNPEHRQISECLMLYETLKRGAGWQTGSGGGGCGPVADHPEVIGASSGQNRNDEQAFSHADGLVYKEEVRSIRVTWEDGEEQTVDVVNGSYLTFRDGLHTVEQIDALDADGNVIYTHESPEPAPGKEAP